MVLGAPCPQATHLGASGGGGGRGVMAAIFIQIYICVYMDFIFP